MDANFPEGGQISIDGKYAGTYTVARETKEAQFFYIRNMVTLSDEVQKVLHIYNSSEAVLQGWYGDKYVNIENESLAFVLEWLGQFGGNQ